MKMGEKRYIRPVMLKFGVALAISLGGILYVFLRTKRLRRPPQSPSSPRPSDSGNQIGSENEIVGRRYDSSATFILQEEHDSGLRPEDNMINGLSPSSRFSGDKDGYLLPEINELVKESDQADTRACNSPRKDVETLMSDAESPTGYKAVKRNEHDQEIMILRNMVRILKERERTLEIQLLKYYGLKEQETAVMELQNRLKINNMEAKLFTLKIESLQADNRRLEAQVANNAKVVADLEAARAKIKLLKRKLRSEAEQNKEQILDLQQRVTKLQEQEEMAVTSNPELQSQFQKLKDLEEEAEELRKTNYSLQLENSDLGKRMEYAQILATSVLEDEETEALKEEHKKVKKQNEDLAKEIDLLQGDRCADVEELVYLRWINACLRYELRHYQPGPGKTVARDLSKSLSPKSEEKAKQLILEYANKEGLSGRRINSTEFDSDYSSSSQASFLMDSGDCDDNFIDNSSASKTNTPNRTFFGKLVKLLRGHGHDQHHHHHRLTRGSSLEMPASVEDVVGSFSTDSPLSNAEIPTGIDGQSNKSRTSSLSSSRHSLDSSSRRSLDLHRSLYFQRSKTGRTDDSSDLEGGQRNSDDAGSSSDYKKFVCISEDIADSPQENQLNEDQENGQKAELLKYARALEDTHGKTPSFHNTSASFNS